MGNCPKQTCSFHPKTTGLEITFPASGPAGLSGGTDVMRILVVLSTQTFQGKAQVFLGLFIRGFPNPQLTTVWKNDALKLKVTGDSQGDFRLWNNLAIMRSVLSLHWP